MIRAVIAVAVCAACFASGWYVNGLRHDEAQANAQSEATARVVKTQQEAQRSVVLVDKENVNAQTDILGDLARNLDSVRELASVRASKPAAASGQCHAVPRPGGVPADVLAGILQHYAVVAAYADAQTARLKACVALSGKR
jgi:hypothetical protein